MNEIAVSPIKKWQSLFEEQPLDELDRLLLGRAYLGVLNRNDTDEILYRLFHTQSRAQLSVLDQAMKNWFIKYWETRPAAVSIQRWNEILHNAFSTVIRLNLSETQEWLFENYQRACVWLHSLYLGPDSEPEAELLRLLALSQRDQILLPLWMRLCRLEEDRPLHFADIGLLGLQKLPNENGAPHADIHSAVFSGIVDLARAIDKQIRSKKEGKDFWFLKVRAIISRYPRSSQYWREHFLPLLPSDPNSTESKWLGQLIPKIKQDFRSSRKAAIASTKDLVMPSSQEFGVIQNLIEKCSLEDIRPKLETFLKKHENYALKTGFADFLVKVFAEIAYKILRQDAEWALSLVQKAFTWAPYNPFLWTEQAKIELYNGRKNSAIELLWEAKRKFPENPHIRTDLAEMLRKSGKFNIAELIYRQAIEDFPTNKVCRTGLGEVLLEQLRFDEAEAIFYQAIGDFPNNPHPFVGLAVVFLIRGNIRKSIHFLQETIRKFLDVQVAKIILEKIKKDPENYSAIIQALDESTKMLEETTQFGFKDKDKISRVTGSTLSLIEKKDTGQESGEILILSDTDENQEEDKLFKEEFHVADRPLRQQIPEEPSTGNGKFETQLGLANLYRLASRRAIGAAKEQYEIEFKKACEGILAEQPNNIFASLEKGFWLLEQNAQSAKQYFAQYSQNSNKTGVLGFRIGYILAKIQQSEQVTTEEWNKLMTDFSNRRLLIAYENVSQELHQSDGKTLSMLESLRKEMQKDLESLPGTLRKNEEWLRSTIAERLFKGIDLNNSIKNSVLPKILENHAQNDLILKSVMEQSLVNF